MKLSGSRFKTDIWSIYVYDKYVHYEANILGYYRGQM